MEDINLPQNKVQFRLNCTPRNKWHIWIAFNICSIKINTRTHYSWIVELLQQNVWCQVLGVVHRLCSRTELVFPDEKMSLAEGRSSIPINNVLSLQCSERFRKYNLKAGHSFSPKMSSLCSLLNKQNSSYTSYSTLSMKHN